MKALRKAFDRLEPLFHKGGKYERFYAIYEMFDTIHFTPGEVTKGNSHVRAALDLKRMMFTVVIALIPCILWAMYNTGYQIHWAMAGGAPAAQSWQSALYAMLGLGFDPNNLLANVLHGALYFLPVYAVTMAVGGFWEVLFAVVRKHDVTEGFLVTGALIPLIEAGIR